jgi:serine/threonine protein kinase
VGGLLTGKQARRLHAELVSAGATATGAEKRKLEPSMLGSLGHSSEACRDLVARMLAPNPADRPTVNQVMQHRWFSVPSFSSDSSISMAGGADGQHGQFQLRQLPEHVLERLARWMMMTQ